MLLVQMSLLMSFMIHELVRSSEGIREVVASLVYLSGQVFVVLYLHLRALFVLLTSYLLSFDTVTVGGCIQRRSCHTHLSTTLVLLFLDSGQCFY